MIYCCNKKHEFIISAVPSQSMRSTKKRVAQLCSVKEISSIQGWVIVCQRIETDTLKLMSDVLLEELLQITSDKLLVLSGHLTLRRFPETFHLQSLPHLKTENWL
jgi:glycerol-3-phosphate dehydrogenase